MTFLAYTGNIPAEDHNPSNDQDPMMVNTNSIESWVEVDHYGFSDNLGGWHNVIHIPQISGNSDPSPIPTTPAPAGQIYTKTLSGAVELFYEDNLGNITQLSQASTGILPRVAVNFTVGASPTFTITINNSSNVSSVVRNTLGVYTVNFTTPLTSQYYYPYFSGQGTSIGGPVLATLFGINAYLPTTTSIQFQFVSVTTGNQLDPYFGSVMIFL